MTIRIWKERADVNAEKLRLAEQERERIRQTTFPLRSKLSLPQSLLDSVEPAPIVESRQVRRRREFGKVRLFKHQEEALSRFYGIDPDFDIPAGTTIIDEKGTWATSSTAPLTIENLERAIATLKGKP